MTPIDPTAAIGASKAVAKVAGKVLEEEPRDRDTLRQIAEKSGELEPAARAYAKRLAVKEQIRLKLWQPLGWLLGGMRSDYFDFQFEDEMADRLSDVPEEDLVPPKGSLAGPAIQGLGFTVEEPELREMYLNLLATASDRRIAASAHPSFAEVIKQLTAEEARALVSVLASPVHHPIVQVNLKSATAEETEKKGHNVLAMHVMAWEEEDGGPVEHGRYAMFVDNWIRLRLIDVDYDSYLTREDAYSWVDENAEVVKARELFDTDDWKRIAVQRGVLRITDFGQTFARVVIRSTTSQPATSETRAVDGGTPS